jgi:hypothetical protein
MKINVLGTPYTIKERNEDNDPRLKDCDGYCDDTTKLIVVDNHLKAAGDLMAKGDLNKHKKKVKRHEIVHAFLFESGLAECSEWARCKEAVDWIASQFPKLLEAFQKADCL